MCGPGQHDAADNMLESTTLCTLLLSTSGPTRSIYKLVSRWSSTGPGERRHVSRLATLSDVRTLKEGLRRRPTRQLSFRLPVLSTDHIIVVP